MRVIHKIGEMTLTVFMMQIYIYFGNMSKLF